MFRKPVAVVLGANGQLGSDLMRCFSMQNLWNVVGATRRDINLEAPDLSDLLMTGTFDLLINCTGYHKTDEVEANPEKAKLINAEAVRIMAQVCAHKKARFVHITTDYVFGVEEREPGNPYVETDETGPLNVYGASKRLGEEYILNISDDAVIVRVASLFGRANSSGKGRNFVETMFDIHRQKQMAERAAPLTVVNDQIMSPTSTADAAGAILQLALYRSRGVHIFHVVNRGEASWYDFAKEIFTLAGVKKSFLESCRTFDRPPTPAKRPSYSALSTAKLESVGIVMPHWHVALGHYILARKSTQSPFT